MADEPRYSDEIRVPISFTLPWSGRFTPNGHPWPTDAKGREWPSDNRGDPEFPIDLQPKGFAPGTSDIYEPGNGRTLAERFAAMDAAMVEEGRLAGERARHAAAYGARLASQSPIQRVADDGDKDKEEREREEKRALPHSPLTRGVTGLVDNAVNSSDSVRGVSLLGSTTMQSENRSRLVALSPAPLATPNSENAPAEGDQAATPVGLVPDGG